LSKELNLVNFSDAPATEAVEIAIRPETIKLDDLSLALVGGGQAAVVF